MRKNIFLVVIALGCISMWAADKIVPPNIRLGLWEITENHTMTGMPAMPAIPPEALANMTPEQRAQMEARMKGMAGGGPRTTTRKYCVTKEKLEKDAAFGEDRKECTRTVLSSSSTMSEVKVHCVEHDMTSDGIFKIEALSKESVKGNMKMAMTGRSQNMNMNMNFDFVSKYLGAECGDVK